MLAAALVAAAAAAPLVQLLTRVAGGGTEAAASALLRPRTADLLVDTLALTATVSALALALGIALATAAVRVRLPGRRLWWIALCLPLAVPSYVGAFAWTATWPTVDGFWPLVIVLTLCTVPYVTLPAMAALSTLDDGLVDVARTLGRGRVRVYVTVVLPHVLPAAAAGALLVALYALSDFGAPAILRVETLTTGVYAQFSSGFDRTLAATTALLLAAVAVVCVAGERLIRPRTARTRTTASARPAVELGRAGTAATMTALAVVTAASVLFPVVALGIRMLRSDRYASTPVDLAGALGTTVGISALAATVAVAVALPVSILAARYRGPLVTGLESVSYLGHALPGVVVALALVTLSLQFFPGAYQSALVLLAAYGILFLPKSIGASRAAIAQVPEELEETSRTLGRGPVRTWLRVTLPGALPGILAGWVLVATAVAKELPATLMLRPIGFDTLATELWSKTSLGAYGAAAPIGVLLILAGIAPALLLARGLERRRTTSGRMAP